jgi:hypothetical protein
LGFSQREELNLAHLRTVLRCARPDEGAIINPHKWLSFLITSDISTIWHNITYTLFVHLRQIRDPHQTILAGESQRLVSALRLGHAEDSMIARIVNFNVPTIIDN